MPTNRIVVERENGVVKLTVWDNAGNSYDCSPIFEDVRCFTAKGRGSSSLSLKADDLLTNMRFDSVKKELIYDVAPEVVNQVLQMLP